MGTIYYGGSATPIHIEDRALAHLKVVISTKLRRDESFTVSWRHPEDQARGRSTLWVHPSIPLRFVFENPEPDELSCMGQTKSGWKTVSSARICMMLDSPPHVALPGPEVVSVSVDAPPAQLPVRGQRRRQPAEAGDVRGLHRDGQGSK